MLTTALRAAFDRSGLSAYALAKVAGVSIQQITRWIKGERDITLATADKLAEALGVKLPK